MAKRPGVRQSDLDRAAEAAARFCALGMKPTRVAFGHQGGFILDFSEKAVAVNDNIDAALSAFEAEHGHD
jgi:hypothetical protein